jgi:serine/threonine protein kinase
MWNLGAILYVVATGEYPFAGNDDAEIMESIRERPENWSPQWKRGTNELLKQFITKLLNTDTSSRLDKVEFLNDEFVLQHEHLDLQPMQDLYKRIRAPIYYIHAKECFIEATLTYFQIRHFQNVFVKKVKKEIKKTDPARTVLAPLSVIQTIYNEHFGDMHLYKIHFNPVFDCYLAKKDCESSPDMEIDIQVFLNSIRDTENLTLEKKLLRATILISYVSFALFMEVDRVS